MKNTTRATTTSTAIPIRMPVRKRSCFINCNVLSGKSGHSLLAYRPPQAFSGTRPCSNHQKLAQHRQDKSHDPPEGVFSQHYPSITKIKKTEDKINRAISR